jgi:hypothetical protein
MKQRSPKHTVIEAIIVGVVVLALAVGAIVTYNHYEAPSAPQPAAPYTAAVPAATEIKTLKDLDTAATALNRLSIDDSSADVGWLDTRVNSY